MIKKILSLFLILSMIISISGCTNKKNNDNDADLPNLIYYTIGNPDVDLDKVNAALNDILKDKIGITVDYKKIVWSDYNSEINSVINSSNFDIAFVAGKYQGDFSGNAEKGVWLKLDSYLNSPSNKLIPTINHLFWDGIKINDSIYGIPTNKELATPEWFIFSKNITKKYNIDISQYKNLKSLDPLLSFIRKNEPGTTPFMLTNESRNFFAIDGYEYLTGQDLPIMYNVNDDSPTLVNIFETEKGIATVNTLRDFYLKGYINEDAAIREVEDSFSNENIFMTMWSGGPYSDSIWERSYNMPVITSQISPSVVTTESTRGSVMVVNSKTKYPDKCVEFLNLINTNSEVRNLLNYGIKDVHYTLTEENQIEKISDTYSGVQYTQGNWFILNTTKGEPLDKWTQFEAFNDNCIESKLLGFSPDLSEVTAEVDNVSTVQKKYYSSIMTGTVNPNEFLPKLNKELKAAGLDKIISTVQAQIDDWLITKKKKSNKN